MTIQPLSEKRKAQIRKLRPDWLDQIEEQYISDGSFEMTVWPDEELIYFGTDEEFTEVVKKYNLDHSTTGEGKGLWNTY